MPTRADIHAAGAVVFRKNKGVIEVLLVHRPRYDDWAYPKGKVDRGEHHTAAAQREVEEETGLRIRLMRPLITERYRVRTGMKRVDYWVGRIAGSDDVSGYEPNDEIDQVRWVEVDAALRLLSYRNDRTMLRAALKARKKTQAVIVLRHADSWARTAWHRDDRLRPLVVQGKHQATKIATVLRAFGVNRIVSSSSTRCVETVAPFAALAHLGVETTDTLSEEDATREGVLALVGREIVDLVNSKRPGLVLCSHGPVLPFVFEALGIPDPDLDKGGMLVAHLRRGVVLATELH